jgi:hypothetical protein
MLRRRSPAIEVASNRNAKRKLRGGAGALCALPERRVTVHSGDMGYTIGLFARRAKCPGRSVILWMNG